MITVDRRGQGGADARLAFCVALLLSTVLASANDE